MIPITEKYDLTSKEAVYIVKDNLERFLSGNRNKVEGKLPVVTVENNSSAIYTFVSLMFRLKRPTSSDFDLGDIGRCRFTANIPKNIFPEEGCIYFSCDLSFTKDFTGLYPVIKRSVAKSNITFNPTNASPLYPGGLEVSAYKIAVSFSNDSTADAFELVKNTKVLLTAMSNAFYEASINFSAKVEKGKQGHSARVALKRR